MKLQIYTDGFCFPNPGFGTWAFAVVLDNRIFYEASGYEADSTNNRMEIKAIYEALKWIKEESCKWWDVDPICSIFSDSQLCVQTLNNWAKKWQSRGWKKKNTEYKNLDLIKPAFELFENIERVSLEWVKGHDGNKFNEHADRLCLLEYRRQNDGHDDNDELFLV